jgi:hypothetical protein
MYNLIAIKTYLHFNKVIAIERQRGSTLFLTSSRFSTVVSPESTRPSLSRDLCIVEISTCVCLSVFLSIFPGEIIKLQGHFFK